MTHTDINIKGWVGHIPPVFRPYALLMRLDRPIGTWLLLLPGWWAIVMAAGGTRGMNAEPLWIFFLFGIGAVIMRGAGCVINDLWDRRLDQKVERTKMRPLASGAITIPQAFIFLVFLLFLGLAILVQMNAITVAIGFLSLIFIVAYPFMKRITWWPQAFLGLTFNFGALMGWSAVSGTIEAPAILLYCAGFFWTLGYDTVYAYQDIEDDLTAGIKSTALRLGNGSLQWVARFYAAAWFLIVMAFVVIDSAWVSYIALAAAGMHLWWQINTWVPQDSSSALRIFKSNRDFGLLILIAAVLCRF